MDIKKEWQHFLIDIEKSGAEVAADIGQTAPNLNKKIRTGSIRAVELADIVERYGYRLAIIKAAEK